MKLQINDKKKNKNLISKCIDVIRLKKQPMASKKRQKKPFFKAAETDEELKEAYESYMTVMLD